MFIDFFKKIPRLEPCGTPAMLYLFEEIMPFKLTYWVRLYTNDFILKKKKKKKQPTNSDRANLVFEVKCDSLGQTLQFDL